MEKDRGSDYSNFGVIISLTSKSNMLLKFIVSSFSTFAIWSIVFGSFDQFRQCSGLIFFSVLHFQSTQYQFMVLYATNLKSCYCRHGR